MTRRVSSVLSVVIAVVLCVAGCSGGRAPDTDVATDEVTTGPVDPGLSDRLAGSVGGDGAFAHLAALQAIADREGGNRAWGTRGYDASVNYVADTLRRAGFVVQTPTFTASAESDDEESAGDVVVTRNVVAETTSGRASEVVLAGAHLDSVPEGPGIDDDGSGVAALLETALRLGNSPPAANKVRFVFFGAEEEGLLGSQDYVATLSSQQRRDIALMLNFDMIAGANAGYFVYDGDNSDRRGEAAAQGAAAIEALLADRVRAQGVAPGRAPFNEDSDYDPFLKAGIPTGGLFAGDVGIKSPQEAAAWGGRAGVAYDPCYHQACDTLTNIDRVALDRMTAALASGIGAFATDLRGVPPRSRRASR